MYEIEVINVLVNGIIITISMKMDNHFTVTYLKVNTY